MFDHRKSIRFDTLRGQICRNLPILLLSEDFCLSHSALLDNCEPPDWAGSHFGGEKSSCVYIR